MKIKSFKIATLAYLAVFCFAHNSAAFSLFGSNIKPRNYIYIVGSSTISPLMATISEEFSRMQNINDDKNILFPTPIVESTGTGQGFKRFCQGDSLKYPDFVNASRAINEREIYLCKKNNVVNIEKIKIGYDGIVIGNYIKSKTLKITKEQLFLALAKRVYDRKTKKLINNPYKKWSDINPKLPRQNIKIFGPPKTSGTRDVFEEIVMKGYCKKNLKLIQSYSSKTTFNNKCHEIRNDGAFIESGENDHLIINKLKSNPNSFGIFGYNFLAINKNIIHPTQIDGIIPSKNSIAMKKYSLSRPLYVYFKVDNIDKVDKVKEFIKEIISKETIGKNGYLIHSGLIPLSKSEFVNQTSQINNLLQNN